MWLNIAPKPCAAAEITRSPGAVAIICCSNSGTVFPPSRQPEDYKWSIELQISLSLRAAHAPAHHGRESPHHLLRAPPCHLPGVSSVIHIYSTLPHAHTSPRTHTYLPLTYQHIPTRNIHTTRPHTRTAPCHMHTPLHNPHTNLTTYMHILPHLTSHMHTLYHTHTNLTTYMLLRHMHTRTHTHTCKALPHMYLFNAYTYTHIILPYTCVYIPHPQLPI